MALKGFLAGVDYTATVPFSKGFFFKGDVRFATGRHKYSSQRTGTHNNNPTYYIEMRPLAGKDFLLSTQYHQNKWSIGPYVTYWNVAKSDVQKGFIESKNNTIEAGLKVEYTF